MPCTLHSCRSGYMPLSFIDRTNSERRQPEKCKHNTACGRMPKLATRRQAMKIALHAEQMSAGQGKASNNQGNYSKRKWQTFDVMPK